MPDDRDDEYIFSAINDVLYLHLIMQYYFEREILPEKKIGGFAWACCIKL